MFLIIFIISLKPCIIRPSLPTISMFSPILPHAFISITFPLTLIGFQKLNESSSPMSPSFFPLTLQHISIALFESAISLRQIINPLAFITSSIGPNLFALAILLFANPFACIFCSSLFTKCFRFCDSYKGIFKVFFIFLAGSILK